MAGLEQTGEHERRYQELRLRVQQRHSTLAGLEPEDDGLPAAVGELVEATDELLAFEDRLPVLQDLPARALSVHVVRAAALATVLGAVLLGLGIWRDVLGWGWLPVILLAVLASVRTATLSVAPAAGQHRRQRYLAAGCGIGGLLTGPVAVLWGWPAALACAAVQVACLVVLLEPWQERL